MIKSIMNTETIVLVGICMKSTYFNYKGRVYEKTHVVAMGSPISPMVANIYI